MIQTLIGFRERQGRRLGPDISHPSELYSSPAGVSFAGYAFALYKRSKQCDYTTEQLFTYICYCQEALIRTCSINRTFFKHQFPDHPTMNNRVLLAWGCPARPVVSMVWWEYCSQPHSKIYGSWNSYLSFSNFSSASRLPSPQDISIVWLNWKRDEG